MIKTFLCLILIIFISTGCSFKDSDNQSQEKTSKETQKDKSDKLEQQQYGEVLKISCRIPKSFNPLINEDTTVDNMLKIIFEPLAILDENLKPQPNLAESFEYLENSIIVHMKEGLTWTNGTPITAYDVAFSIDTIKGNKNSIYREYADNIVSYNVIDDMTIQINFKYSSYISAYSLCFPVISQEYYKDDLNNMIPMGNGAYIFKEYIPNDKIILTKNVNYFKGEPNIDTIEVLITPDTQTDYYAFEQGFIDIIVMPLNEWNKYSGLKEVNIYEYASTSYDFIGFNLNNYYLQNKKVRQAILYSIDTQSLIQSVYSNQAEKTLSPINPNSWLYDTTLEPYEYNVEKAKLILENENLYQNGTTEMYFRILVNEENIERMKVAEIISDSLAQIGISTEIVAVPFEEYIEKLLNKDYDIVVAGLNLSQIPDLSFMFKTNESGNYFGYSNDIMDLQLELVLKSSSEEELIENISNVQKTIANDIPIISIVFKKSALITDTKLYGITSPNINNPYINIQDWYILE